MISGCYLGSALATIPLGLVFPFGTGGPWLFIALVVAAFFLASAGASAANLTLSEIFPMETRALAIAFFYAVDTAMGGIAGPLLFGQLSGSNVRVLVMVALFTGAAVMAADGITEIFFGINSERSSLESIAAPRAVHQAEKDEPATGEPDQGSAATTD
jgi:MFS family permease